MDLLKAAPEVLAEFLSFLVSFTSRPRLSLRPYLTLDNDESPAKVSGKLTLFCALGVGLALVLVRAGEALGMTKDESSVLVPIAGIDPLWLPLVVTIAMFGFGAFFHVVAKLLSPLVAGILAAFFPSSSPTHLRGATESVNAVFAWASWVVPAVTFVLVAVRIHQSSLGRSPWVEYGSIFAIVLATYGYFIAAFSEAHRASIGHVLCVLCASVSPFVIYDSVSSR